MATTGPSSRSVLDTLKQISVIRGDISKLSCDAIVNAAKQSLLGGGGVDGAIHRAAGPLLLKECRALKGCPTGQARITKAYQLPATYVIHTVGPKWRGGYNDEEALLRQCYINSMDLASRNDCKSIAFPSISCGAYGFPFQRAAKIAVDTILAVLDEQESGIMVTFCCFSRSDLDIYNNIVDEKQKELSRQGA